MKKMRLVRGITEYRGGGGLHLALGNFDGVHRGHQMLLRQAIAGAKKNGRYSGVLIFEPHPLWVLAPKIAPRMLINLERKVKLFAALGINEVIIADFDREVAGWSPRYFVEEVLINRLQIEAAYVGFNYNFGHKGEGTPEMLVKFGQEMGFSVNIIPPVKINDTVVSSTIIRNFLQAGDVSLARSFLGYTPTISGQVIKGEQRGRTLGFPTANIKPQPEILIPQDGVYAAMLRLYGELHPAVVNIGKKPTFHEDYPVTIEAHLPGFEQDFYGETVDLLFIDRLRGEIKFTDSSMLVNQINQDIIDALRILEKWTPSRLDR